MGNGLQRAVNAARATQGKPPIDFNKPPTPQGISALLRKAGFTRSFSTPSRIRGMPERTDGYTVSAHLITFGAVRVEHKCRSEEAHREAITAYAEAIRAKGWTVTEETDFLGNLRLKVARPEGTED